MRAKEALTAIAEVLATHGDVELKFAITPYSMIDVATIQPGYEEVGSPIEGRQIAVGMIIPDENTLEVKHQDEE